MEEDVEILEEPVLQSVNTQSSQAPTLPEDITSTTEGGTELTVVIPSTSMNVAEELMMLNNQYGAAAATIQEYVSRMNTLEVHLEPFNALDEVMRDILAPTQYNQKNSN